MPLLPMDKRMHHNRLAPVDHYANRIPQRLYSHQNSLQRRRIHQEEIAMFSGYENTPLSKTLQVFQCLAVKRGFSYSGVRVQ